MSQTIDNRVVQLDFENEGFESKVSQSLGTLEKLKNVVNNLRFDNVEKNFSSITNATKSFDASSITIGIQDVGQKFSVVGTVVTRILENITDSAIRAGSSLVSAISTPIQMMKSGGLNRALNIEQASFMLEGLGLQVEQIKEDAMYAVKGTAYGFDEAAKVASTFGASGVKAGEEMKKALLGVSGVAAMTGRSYQDIGDIFSTIASNGKLMTMQLRQFSASGLNVSAALAKYLGTTEENINEMVTKGVIDFETFSNAMNDTFGAHAKDANKTFNGALSNMKAALSRIGADVASVYLEKMRVAFVNLTTVIDNLHEKAGPVIKDINLVMSEIIGRFSKGLLDPRITNIMEDGLLGLQNTLWGISSIILPIKDAFKEVFNTDLIGVISNSMKAFKDFSEGLILNDQAAERLKNTFISIFSSLKDLKVTIEFLFDKIKQIPILSSAIILVGNILLNICNIIRGVEERVNIFDNVFKKTKKEVKDDIEEIGETVEKSTSNFENAKNKILNILSHLPIIGPFIKIKMAVKETGDEVKKTVDSVGETAEKTTSKFESIKNKILNILSHLPIIGPLIKIKMAVKETGDEVEKAGNTVEKTTKKVYEFTNPFEKIEEFLKKIAKRIGEIINNTFSAKSDLFDVVDVISRVQDLFKAGGIIGILTTIKKLIKGIDTKGMSKSIIGFLNSLTQKGILGKLTENITKNIQALSKSVSTDLGKLTDNIAKNLKKLKGSISGEDIKSIGMALLMLAGALFIIAQLDIKQIAISFTTLTFMMGELAAAFVIINKLLKDVELSSFATMITMASAILILSFAMRTLAKVNVVDSIKGIITIAFLMGEIIGFTFVMSKLNPKNFIKASKVLIKFAIAMNLMALAIRQLASISINGIIKGIGAIGVMLLEIAMFVDILKEIKPKNFQKVAGSLIAFSIGINLMALAIRQIGSMDLISIAKGLGGLAILMLEIVGFTALIQKLKPTKFLIIAIAINAFAIGINMLALAVEMLGHTDPVALGSGLISLGLIMASLVGVFAALAGVKKIARSAAAIVTVSNAIGTIANAIATLASKDTEAVAWSSLSLISMLSAITFVALALKGLNIKSVIGISIIFNQVAKSITKMASGIVALSSLPTEGIMVGTAAILIMLWAVTRIMKKFNDMDLGKGFQAAQNVSAIGGAIKAIGEGIAKVGELPIANILASTLALSAILIVMLKVCKAFMEMKGVGAVAVELLVLGIALIPFARAIKILSEVSVGGLITALVGLGGALLIIGLAAKLLGPVAAGSLLAIAGSLALIGLAASAAGAGVLLFGLGLEAIAHGIYYIIEAIKDFLDLLVRIGEMVFPLLIEIGKGLGVLIISFLQPIAAAGGEIVASFIKGVASKLGELINAGINFLLTFLKGLASKIGEITKKGIEIVVGFIKAVASKLGDIIQAGIELALAFINGVADGLINNVDKIVDAITRLGIAIIVFMIKALARISEVGLYLVQGLWEGIKNGWEWLKNKIKEFCDKVKQAFKDFFKIKSPSKETYEDGKYLDEGLALGISDNADVVDGSIEDLTGGVLDKLDGLSSDTEEKGSGIFDWIKSKASDVKDSLGGDIDSVKFKWLHANDEEENSITHLTLAVDKGIITQEEYNSKIKETTTKIERNKDQLKALEDAYKSGQIPLSDYEKITKRLKAEIEALIGEIEDLEEALGVLTKKNNDLTDAMNKNNREFKKGVKSYGEWYAQDQQLIRQKVSITKAINETTLALGKESKALDEDTEAKEENMEATTGAGKAQEDFLSSLTSTLEGQLDIFKKFEAKNPMSKDELLNNMKSQIKGMTDWANQMSKLSQMGIDQGLYKKLAEMGPEGAEYVGAFVSMSAEELGMANELWAESLVLPGAVAKQIGVNMNEVGQNTLIGFQNGLDAQTNATLTQLGVIANDGVNKFATEAGCASPSWKFFNIGLNCMAGLINGIDSRKEHLYNELIRICNTAVELVKQKLAPEKFEPIGADVVNGLKQGIESVQGEVITMLEELGAKMLEAIKSKKALDEESPSHAMEEIGEYAVMGLANGINNKSGIAVKSVTDMGSDVVSQMKQTIANIASMINNEMEDPVITPVLDLSKVQAGARLLNSTFSANAAIAAGGSQLGALQNGQYSQGGITFNQYNNSPKALSRIDIYRDTRNMLSQFRQATT